MFIKIHREMSATFFVLIFLFLTSLSRVNCEASDDNQRNITVTYNDGCDIPECEGVNGTFYNLVHYRAKGSLDAIHFVWASVGAPGLLMVRTSLEARLKVDWKKMVNASADAIKFDPANEVYASSAVVLSRIIEYDDPNDTAEITNITNPVNTDNLTWSNVTIFRNNNTAVFTTELGDAIAATNGSLSIEVQTAGIEGRMEELPHLQHTCNTTEFSLILDNLQQTFNHSRFAIELLVVRDQEMEKDSEIKMKINPSIDDEHTPAVFETYEVLLNRTSTSKQGSYLQWKPVVYTKRDRETGNSKLTKVYELNENASELCIPNYSVAHAYYGGDFVKVLDVRGFNISFGVSKDKFYNNTKYYVWSSTMGYGSPPTEGLSILVISIISAGLGIPVILMIVGGVYVACQRRLATRGGGTSKYVSINS
ncbi:glycosylated lysosomal membrane protein B-like [Diadema setosum]|uniref:glycosylated lysosomal membrane protein B-like n=1 Tax=Diadema setosum TaxID=31175 RepID=UPI003B3AB7CB